MEHLLQHTRPKNSNSSSDTPKTLNSAKILFEQLFVININCHTSSNILFRKKIYKLSKNIVKLSPPENNEN